jgi:hypothetical protein
MLKKKSLDLLKVYFDIKTKSKTDNTEYNNTSSALFVHDRAKIRQPLLTRIDTGSVSFSAYGHAIRKVQMTRGNR